MKRLSLLRRDQKLRDALAKRFEELKLNYKMIISDAQDFDMQISASALSRYFRNETKDQDRNILTEQQIQWLCSRYCIEVNLIVKVKKFENNLGKNNALKIQKSWI